MDQAPAPPHDERLDAAFLARFKLLDESGALDDLAKLRKENRELDTLVNDAAALFAIADIERMIEFAMSRIVERFIPTTLVFIFEGQRGTGLRQYHYRGLARVAEEFPPKAYAALRSHLAAFRFPTPVETLAGIPGLAPFLEAADASETDFVLPMQGIDGLFGAVLLGKKLAGGEYNDLERMYIDRMSRFLSIGIQNGIHYESAITDAKTGLYNHPYFLRRLEEEAARASRRDTDFGLIMIDVDRFKIFNDTHGHLAGDALLAAMAGAIRRAVRAEDIVSRFGGEEFCVLVVECDEGSLLEVAERIRGGIERLILPFEGKELSVTASLGCCLVPRSQRAGLSTYLDRADKALYRSKEGGRNRVTLYRAGLLDRAAELRARGGAAPGGSA